MAPRRILQGFLIMVCLVHLAPGLGPVPRAWAERQAMGLFHEALAPHGNWIEYGKYGPVWYPTKTSSSWRPYLDGRWVPSHGGWVFETSEPWGWATYHYGNWMPTTEYGWVWSPGSTWYPATVAWRTSDDYIGWAPIPPPDYVPEPAFYPAQGYTPGAPVLDLLAAPLWTFIRAAGFLLGLGQPFAPVYSYYNSMNLLAPFSYGPIVYGGTFPLTDFYYPAYATAAFYSFGPPFPFVSRVTNIDIAQINGFVTSHNFPMMRNVLPPAAVLGRFPFLREAIPGEVLEGRRFPITRVQEVALAEHALNRPGVLAPPAPLPVPSKTLPLVMPGPLRAVGPANLEHLKGMSLPRQAEQPLTPGMRQQIRVQRQLEELPRIETRPEFRPLAKPEILPQVIPAPGRAVFGAKPQPASPEEFRRGLSQRLRTSSGFRASVPREFRAAPPPVFRAVPQATFGPRVTSPPPRGPAPALTVPPPPQVIKGMAHSPS